MLKNIAAVLVLTLICAGCRSNHRKDAHVEKQPGKIILNVNIEHKQSTVEKSVVPPKAPAAAKRSTASNARKKAVPAAVKNRPVQEKVPRGSIESDLNSVEQQHLREIRRRNQKNQMENEKRVFGGFSAGELFK